MTKLDQTPISDADLVTATGGKSAAKTRIDTGLIDFTGQQTSVPRVDSGMIDFTGQQTSVPRVDSGMIDFTGQSHEGSAPELDLLFRPRGPR